MTGALCLAVAKLRLVHGEERGFTLLEVLVAIAILSLLAVALPVTVSGWHARTELRQSEHKLDQLLNQARQEAARGHRAVTVKFEPDNARIGIPALGVWFDIPPEQKVTVLGIAQGVRQETPAIVFASDGYNTGGVITIEQGALRVSRRIEWLTGRLDHDRQ